MSSSESLLVANDEPQNHSGRDITVGILDKQSTPSTDCPWVPSSHYIATEYGLLIDIGSMGHLYDIDAIAICDAIVFGNSSWKLQWTTEKWRYLQIAHVFGVKHFIVAITIPDGLSVIHCSTYCLYIES